MLLLTMVFIARLLIRRYSGEYGIFNCQKLDTNLHTLEKSVFDLFQLSTFVQLLPGSISSSLVIIKEL